MPNEFEPARLMTYEPRVDGKWRQGWFFGAFRMRPTAADLLTDPRVRELEAAARAATVTDEDWVYADMGRLRRALAAFEAPRE